MLFAAFGVGGATSIAGCSSVLGEPPERHSVDMYNSSGSGHRFEVTVIDASGETIFRHEYDLGAGKGDENRVIEGTPSRVTLVVDGEERWAFDWAPLESSDFVATHPDGCPGDTSTGLTIWYDSNGVRPVYGCETARE